MTPGSEDQFALFLSQLSVLLSLGLVLGGFSRRLGQPPLVGEILAGIVLGPSLLGVFAPESFGALFGSPHTATLGVFALLGALFLVLVAGTEIEVAVLARERRAILSTSLIASVLPFVAGLVFAWHLPDRFLVDPGHRWSFMFFLATAMSISAIPVIAKILMDLDLFGTAVGHVVMGAAAVDDVVGWIFFAVLLGVMNGDAVSGTSVLSVLVVTVGLSAFCLTVGRWLTARFFALSRLVHLPPQGVLGFTVLIAFFCAALVQLMGIHAVFGALLAGVMIGGTGELDESTRSALRGFALYVFAPIFFASMGLRTNFVSHFDLPLVVGVVAVSILTKVVAGTLGARLARMAWAEAVAVGLGLMPRGAMGMILAFLALEHSLITEQVFVALIIAAVVTSIMSGPLMRLALGGAALARTDGVARPAPVVLNPVWTTEVTAIEDRGRGNRLGDSVAGK